MTNLAEIFVNASICMLEREKQMAFTGVKISSSDTLRHKVAKAIWHARPDCKNKEWPLTDDKSIRAYLHEPVASIDLSFIYADIAIGIIQNEQ